MLITRHKEFAAAVSSQLLGLELSLQTLTPEAARDIARLRELAPDVAFVDFDAVTSEGLPLHKALANAVPDCQVILLCDREQAAASAKLVRVCEVFDYLLIDEQQDLHRIAVLIDRARTNGLPHLAEIRGFAKLQYRRILETLGELRTILKSEGDNPIVRLIRDYRLGNDLTDLTGVDAGAEMAEEYKRCLVDLICGRLRRLERDVLASELRDTSAARTASDAVLIVEDDVVSAEIAKFILERNGFEVVVAKSADAARSAMARQVPALVLMDVHLAGADGLHVVRMMRRSPDYCNVPVIVVTADRLRSTLFDAMNVQIQGYLLKPYQPKELIEKVKTIVDVARGKQKPDRPPCAAAPEPSCSA